MLFFSENFTEKNAVKQRGSKAMRKESFTLGDRMGNGRE